ncbi:heavy-metal-associated domain-containing protein [Nocardioides sp. ChNu-153]|uniref:heavy-metal-associated domain-containing protein n=1 Tax=unclassified Nocardioides TaxID=2615069 RepID=UPI002404B884|nr:MULTISPECIES: heavy-metal-associated domain-containing protein [unclassified Nocardioides]MDF9714852.1 heavy-metal-associated domain-containing protein [Nocardioides sp. ChNu-99]MDN7120022.1 heavy-metal-associated domain-containing protein [Nocardioides sp. ChNu-153]
MATATFDVVGMTCGHCEASVREEVLSIGDISDAVADASQGILVVTTVDVVGEQLARAVVAAVGEAGYTAQPR